MSETSTTTNRPKPGSIANQIKFEAVDIAGLSFDEKPKAAVKDGVYNQIISAALLLQPGRAVRALVPDGVKPKKIEGSLRQAIKKLNAGGKLDIKHKAGGVYVIRLTDPVSGSATSETAK